MNTHANAAVAVYTYVISVDIFTWFLHAGVDLGTVDGTVERVANGSFLFPVGVAVVADDALFVLFVPAGSRSPVVESDHERLEMVVVVGEERNLESTGVGTEEVSTLAAGFRAHGGVVDEFHAVVVHVDSVVRQLVRVLEVDAKQLRIIDCELSNANKTSHMNYTITNINHLGKKLRFIYY